MAWTMMRMAMMSVADTCILTAQDLISLGKEARINIPSTVGGNWQWRIDGACINDWLAEILLNYTKMYGRYPKSPVKAAEVLTNPDEEEESTESKAEE